LVLLKRAGQRSTQTHLRYIAREGTGQDEARGRLYGPDTDDADGAAFEARGRGDRHQFRFIVSPEDAAELGDLKTFTRELMARMARDLGTDLDWVAADHWDTDNPHTHIVLRGRECGGRDLVIAREYVAHGMRRRAAVLSMEWLGPRTEREIAASLTREIGQPRWTGLDRAIRRFAREGLVDLSEAVTNPSQRSHRALLIRRLDRLTRMGLAEQCARGLWRLDAQLESTLRIMGKRTDNARIIQRAIDRGLQPSTRPDRGAEPELA
jgi:type IV secretory pathway VirD2 relaxase